MWPWPPPCPACGSRFLRREGATECSVPVFFHTAGKGVPELRVRYVGQQDSPDLSLPAVSKTPSVVQAGTDSCNAQNSQTIKDGTFIHGSVDQQKYACFKMSFIPATFPNFRLELMPTGGDADLYVNIGGDDWPTVFEYDSKATQYGYDQLDLSQGSPAMNGKCGVTTQPCMVYIAITDADLLAPTVNFILFGYDASGGDVVALELDTPILASVIVPAGPSPPKVYNYYNLLNIPAGSSLNIILTQLVGDADLYIGWNTLSRPTSSNNNGAAIGLGGEELAVNCNPAGGAAACDLHIGVHGFGNSNATYTLRVESANQIINLVSGVAQAGELAKGETAQYQFLLPEGNVRGADIWVYPTAGDPDLYVNLGKDVPSPASHQFASFHLSGIEFVGLTPEIVSSSKDCPTGQDCFATIAVRGFSNCSYLITAAGTHGSDNITRLNAGVPVPGHVAPDNFEYYSFQPADYSVPTVISLTPRSGDPDMFIKVSSAALPVHPTQTNYDWRVNGLGNETLIIPPGDPKLWEGSTLYIGVTAFPMPGATSASYFLEAVSDTPTAVTPLTPGVPLQSATEPGTFLNYLFTVEGDEGIDSLQFELTPLTGATRMYIAVAPGGAQLRFPSATCSDGTPGNCRQWTVDPASYDYRGNQMEDGNFVLRLSDPNLFNHKTHFVVGVLGTRPGTDPSRFEIEATITQGGSTSTSTDPVAPINEVEWGQRSDGVVYKGNDKQHVHYIFYSVQVTSPSDIRVLSEASIGGAYLWGSATTQYPKLGSAEFRGSPTFLGATVATMFIPFSRLPQDCQNSVTGGDPCTVYFSVSATSSQISPNTTYSVEALSTGKAAANPAELGMGDTSYGYVDKSEFSYFLTDVDVPLGDALYVSLVSLSGDADLYVNIGGDDVSFYPDADKNPPMFMSLGIEGADTVAIHRDNEHYCTRCHLYISVRGFDTEGSLFTITASSDGSLTPLPPNAPAIAGGVSGGNFTYYRVDMGQFAYRSVSLSVNLQVMAGSPSLVAIVEDDNVPPTLPTSTHYTWGLPYYAEHKSLVISANDDNACGGRHCAYIIGVKGSVREDASFALTATVATDPPSVTTLINGESTPGQVQADQCVYYQFEPAPPGVSPDPPISTDFLWHADTGGALNVYITNAYVAGESGADALPNKYSHDVCKLPFDAGQTEARISESTKPASCYSSDVNQTYTLGVCGVSFGHGGTVEFTILADVDRAPVALAPGQESIPATVDPRYIPDKNFEFIVTDPTRTIAVTADTLQGDVTVYITAPTTSGGVAPPASSTNFQWTFTTAGQPEHVATMEMPANLPCRNGGENCHLNALLVGTYSVNVVPAGQTTARFSLVYEIAGNHVEPVPGEPTTVELAIGSLCRSHNDDGSCASGELSQAYLAWLAYTVPISQAVDLAATTSATSGQDLIAASFTVEVTCGSSGTTEFCGQENMNYMATASVCTTQSCSGDVQYPMGTEYGASPDVEVTTETMQLTFDVPAHLCQAGSDGASECTIFVGLFASPTNGQPITDVPPPTMVMTVLDPATPTEIPDACFVAKQTCVLPVATLEPGFEYVRFSGHVEPGAPVNIALRVQVCRGEGSAYVCNDPASGRCEPYEVPSKSNNDAAWALVDSNPGDAPAWSSHSLAAQTGDFFIAVQPRPTAASQDTPTFQMLVQAGNAGLLWLPTSGQGESMPEATYDASAGTVTVTWGDLYAVFPGQRAQTVSGARFTVYLAPTASVSAGAVLDTACGVHLEWAEHLHAVGLSATASGTNSATFDDVPTGTDYKVMVVASCTGGPAGQDHCSVDGVQGQQIAYEATVVSVPGGGHNGKGGGGKKKPSNAGAIAGGVIGGLVGLAALVALGMYLNKHRDSMPCCRGSAGQSGYGGLDDGLYTSSDVGASSGYDRL